MEYLSQEKWRQFGRAMTDGAPDVIVAIARKMPRVLERTGLTGNSPCPIVSERALPWLVGDLAREARLTFCDDVLNYGTTLAHHVQYVRSHGLNDVRVAVFARHAGHRDTHESLGFAEPTTFSITAFDDEYYHEFETALPLELAALGKPYDLDFPIIEVPLLDPPAHTGSEWLAWLKEHFDSVHDLTTPAHRKAGVLAFTIVAPYVATSASTDVLNAKLRLYITSSKVLRVVPIAIAACSASALETYTFPDARLQDVWKRLLPYAAPGAVFALEPLYALWLYLHSLDYARPFITTLQATPGFGPPTLSFTDLCFLYGQPFARELKPRLEAIMMTPREAATGVAPPLPAIVKSALVNDIIQQLCAEGYEGSPGPDVIRATMRALDSITRPANKHDLAYARLRIGLPLGDLWQIVRAVSNDRYRDKFEYVSFLLDYHVDIGAVVPVIEQIGDTYYRSYRGGEATPLEFAAFAHDALRWHDRYFPDTPLTLTAFTKMLSALAIFHEGKLPLRPVFEFHGSVPYLVSDDAMGEQVEEAVSFLVRKNVIRREDPPTDDPQLRLFQ